MPIIKSISLALLGLIGFYFGTMNMVCASTTCSVSSTGLSFGTYVSINTTPTTSSAGVTISCSNSGLALSIGYTIALGAGQGGSFTPRLMTNGTSQMKYNIFTNNQYATIWGDGISNGTKTVTGSFLLLGVLPPYSNTVTIPAYGSIPGQQTTLTSGAYTDAVGITVNF